MYQMVKYLSIAALPIGGCGQMFRIIQDYRQGKEDIFFYRGLKDVPKKTEQWTQNIMRQCGIEPIPIRQRPGNNPNIFGTYADSAILMSSAASDDIENRLSKDHLTSEDIRELDGKVFAIKHEVGHHFYRHVFKSIGAAIAIPTAIQGMSSMVSYACTKAFNIQQPKTKISTFSRGSLLMLALFLKERAWTVADIYYKHHQENQADDFALAHATPSEIAAAIDFFEHKECEFLRWYVENNPNCDIGQVWWGHFFMGGRHPYPGDQAIKAKKYLEKSKQRHFDD